MATDAPQGLINSHVVRGRRPDHTEPKAAKVKTHEPAAVKAEPEPEKAKPAKKADKG